MTDQTRHSPPSAQEPNGTAPPPPALASLVNENGRAPLAERSTTQGDMSPSLRLAAEIRISVYVPAEVLIEPEQPAAVGGPNLARNQRKRASRKRAKARKAAEQIAEDVEVAGNVGLALVEALAVNGAKESGAVR